MSVKRRPARKQGFRTLFANVKRTKKSHRAATTASAADFESDVPNLGIARALVVILLIHVVAIAGIFIHSHRIEDEETAAPKKDLKSASLSGSNHGAAENSGPKIRPGEQEYTVGGGDTYAGIATRFGIDETELREANGNTPIRQGRALRIPAQTITAVEPPEFAALRGEPSAEPAAAPSSAETEDPPEAVRVTPGVERGEWVETNAARRADGETTGSSGSGSEGYTVQPGDTFWGIAQRHGTTVDRLMSANEISDPRKLRAGMTLSIPE